MASDAAGRRRQLLAAVSVLGVSLGMAAPALARDPTAVENPTDVQNSHKGTQTSIKGEQNSYKENVQNSYKENVQNSSKHNLQISQKGTTTQINGGTSNQVKGGASPWTPGGAGGTPAP
jgi:hypothetical protein